MNSRNSFRWFVFAVFLQCILIVGCASNEKKVILHDLQDPVNREQIPEKVVPKHLPLAKDLVDQEHYEVALRQLDLATEKEKGAELYYLQGVCYRETGSLEKALGAFEKSIEYEKSFAMAYNGLGLTYIKMGQWDRGLDALKQAVAYDPARVDFLNNLGYALMREKKYHEAAKYLRRCLTIDPEYVVARNNLAISYGFLGKDQEAISVLLQGNSPEVAYRNMSAIYQMTGEHEKAAAAKQMAVYKYEEQRQQPKGEQ